MRKALAAHRGQKAAILTQHGISFTGYIGEIEDHTLTIWSRPQGQGDRRYLRVEDVVMLAPAEDEDAGEKPRIVTQ